MVEEDEFSTITLPCATTAIGVAAVTVALTDATAITTRIAATGVSSAGIPSSRTSCIAGVVAGACRIAIAACIAVDRAVFATRNTTIEVFVLLGVACHFIGAVAAVCIALAGEAAGACST